MQSLRVVAIPTAVADEVRSTLRAPVYGFRAHVEPSADAAPCRHCLRLIAPGDARRMEPFPCHGTSGIHLETLTNRMPHARVLRFVAAALQTGLLGSTLSPSLAPARSLFALVRLARLLSASLRAV